MRVNLKLFYRKTKFKPISIANSLKAIAFKNLTCCPLNLTAIKLYIKIN